MSVIEVVQLGDLVGRRLDNGPPYLSRRNAITDVAQMNRISTDALDLDAALTCIQCRRIQCRETFLIYPDGVEYALHGESTLCAGQQRPAPPLDAPVRGNSGVG
jgi:hypothetical protein